MTDGNDFKIIKSQEEVQPGDSQLKAIPVQLMMDCKAESERVTVTQMSKIMSMPELAIRILLFGVASFSVFTRLRLKTTRLS